ncbi:hypothetical protein MLD52_21480 [Puniceicoccaceae bacterium K14]|nr:hypothetical protein [Puniceicoccaceae bacterium K14]
MNTTALALKTLGLSLFIFPILCDAKDLQAITIEQSLDPISVSVELPEEYSRIRWEIESDRNQTIAKFSERSVHAPDSYKYPPYSDDHEIWFPTIDIELDPSYTSVSLFENVSNGDTVCLNGNFWDDCSALETDVRYDHHLEEWENQLFVSSSTAELKSFHIEKSSTPKKNDRHATLRFTSLAKEWNGVVSAWGQTENGDWVKIAAKHIKTKAVESDERGEAITTELLDRETVVQNLHTTLNFLLNSQNTNPLSPSYGSLNLFYDLDSKTYRRSDWFWSLGPALNFLTDVTNFEEIADTVSYKKINTSARLVAEASLRQQVTDPSHPAYGLVMCRYDPRTDSPHGAEGYYSPADSYFLAGWGWMPYYLASGDQRFLDASVLMTEGISKILTYDEVVEQDYLMKEGRWKNWTMDESGFGMKGAEQVFKVTQDKDHQAIGRAYIESLLAVLEREDGLWDRTWHRNSPERADNGWPVDTPLGTPKLIKMRYNTRGLGWAMIGLLSSHGLMPEDDVYLNKAIRLAQHLVDAQAAEGHWEFQFSGNNPYAEVSAKGTALWSLLFYQLYEYTKNPEHLDTARKALVWCINNRYLGSDPEAYGGIDETNRESGVVYRRWNRLVCGYTMSWFGLALIEELKFSQ